MAGLGLRCCPPAFSRCSEWSLLSRCGGFCCCGTQAPEHGLSSWGTCGILVPGPGMEPTSRWTFNHWTTGGRPETRSEMYQARSGLRKSVAGGCPNFAFMFYPVFSSVQARFAWPAQGLSRSIRGGRLHAECHLCASSQSAVMETHPWAAGTLAPVS